MHNRPHPALAMTYLQIAYAHLATVVPAFLIGTFLLIRRKGTPGHKQLGRLYLALMAITATITLFMQAEVGPRFFGHFGYIHSLSLLTLVTVPTAFYAAGHHKIALHRNNMVGLYFGGIIIAGSFAFMPGRMLHGWFCSAADAKARCCKGQELRLDASHMECAEIHR